ncbi:hypothetical protein [Halobacillus litoralis]|uniref:hypothetical protein n=1 Tax=Halobacillus litoralis TaxID=45668 RepID=UPI0024927763|nr:hypothetical protein [Halobacillus litoralis]
MNVHKRKIFNPASGAIVMALGVFLQGAMNHFLNQTAGRWFVFAYLLLSIAIYSKLFRQVFQKGFLTSLLKNPVNSFVLGSWIAGFSVLSIVLERYLPLLHFMVAALAVVNSLLWVMFLYICFMNFKQLWARPAFHATHGVVLLSAVATQSVVILWNELFPSLPDIFSLSAFALGGLFYIGGLILIFKRYLETDWSLTEDWTNTNCIIHGGLSITGLAIVSTKMFQGEILLYYWMLVLIIFCLVEGLEVVRAIKRIRQKGWRKGVFSYNVSQWSRNFTFGMFYAFTMVMHENASYKKHLYDFHEHFLSVWAWVVLIALVIEIVLWGGEKVLKRNAKVKQGIY